MLFKFASYLLGTNNEQEEPRPDQQTDQQELTIESNADTQSSSTLIEDNQLNKEANLNKQDLIEEDDYMYAEQLINCSKLKNSSDCNLESTDLNKEEDQLGDQLDDDEDCDEEDDQWIYITPIKRKNEAKELGDPKNCILNENASNENVPNQQEVDHKNEQNELKKEQFNFYDYFNNKSSLTNNLAILNEEEPCSPVKLSKTTMAKKLAKNHHKMHGMEESWVIHPPACFQLDNTFAIEEHPLERIYIENPALSVMASCKSIDKENSTSSLTNSSSLSTIKSSLTNRVLVDRNLNNNQTKETASMSSRKSMRKRANSTRKANKKQNNNSNKKSKKKTDQPISAVKESASNVQPVEQVEHKDADQSKQVLNDRQEKQLLAHYLTMNPTTSTPTSASNTIATSSNGSTHQSIHHSHPHFISNIAFNASTNASVEQKKGSKSLRRQNKTALKRDNLSNKPFTLHRKLC